LQVAIGEKHIADATGAAYGRLFAMMKANGGDTE